MTAFEWFAFAAFAASWLLDVWRWKQQREEAARSRGGRGGRV